MAAYKPSVIQTCLSWDRCYLCGNGGELAVHHVMNGPYRRKSTEDGLVVHLCPECHQNGPYAVHRCKATAEKLKADAQRKYEEIYGHPAWMKRYGRNYL